MKHIVSVSGGKDSTATMLWAIEQGIDFEPVTMDTGWEARETYEYLEELEHRLGMKITRLNPPLGMVDLILKKSMFPSRRFRFCTQQLKVFPFLEYVGDRDVVNLVGIRADESRARAKLPERGPMTESEGVEVWRPLVRWSTQDVIDMHKRHGVPPNPLYVAGSERVGCWPCVFERKSSIRAVVSRDPARIDFIRDLEARVTENAQARYAARGETFESLGYKRPSFFSLKKGKGKDRKSTHVPIDDVVAWSMTARGGKQLLLDHGDGRRGCLQWGLCDAG
jgi:3'-phosphoadenosine 5'-phosphosulfate sulfotransferase (PAPS reductase)/FAD synthetase